MNNRHWSTHYFVLFLTLCATLGADLAIADDQGNAQGAQGQQSTSWDWPGSQDSSKSQTTQASTASADTSASAQQDQSTPVPSDAQPSSPASEPAAQPDAQPAAQPEAQPAPPAPQPVATVPVAQTQAPSVPPPDDGTKLEDVVVTAQKRTQAIQDVPVSMSVMNDKFIKMQGITDIQELLLFVPNMKVETGSTLGGPRCRGFGLNIRNRAFEPPCGVAIDGVPYTSSDYFDLALFDVKRVEVLRGPQGTTFGKNTTAGVVSVITKSPENEEAKGLTGDMSVQVGDLSRKRGEAALGDSLFNGNVTFRIAGMKEDREGYMTNTTAQVVPDAVAHPLSGTRQGIRGKLGFPDLFGSRLMLSYETTELHNQGFGVEPYNVTPTMASYMQSFDPNADFQKGNFTTSLDFPDRLNEKIDTYQADWNTFLWGWTFTAVGVHSVLNRYGQSDADYFPAPAIFGIQADRSPTDSLEIRGIPTTYQGLYGLKNLFGWNLGTSDLLTGVFYQRRQIQNGLLYLGINDPVLLNILAIDSGAPGPSPPPPGFPTNEDVDSVFAQDSKSYAAFGEFQWYFADDWMLQYGMRLQQEDKSATWDQTLSNPHPVLTAAGWAPFTAAKSRSEHQFLPKVALNYKGFEGISLFARWTRGFKGGGFNGFSQTGESSSLTSLTFGPETADEWALDAKMELFDSTAQVNLSVFRLDVKQFQYLVQVNDPNTGFPAGNTVINVGEARSQGVEGDITYLPTHWLRVIATLGLDDTDFVSFPNNQCPQGQKANFCDVSGMPFPFTPKWNNTLTLNAHSPIGNLVGWHLGGAEANAGFTIEQLSKQYLNPDMSSGGIQGGFLRYRANVGFGNPDQHWSFNVIGENLTNVVTSQREDRILGVSGNYPEARRTIYSQLQITF